MKLIKEQGTLLTEQCSDCHIIKINITVSTDTFNDKNSNHFMFMPKVTTNILLCVKLWLNLVTPLSNRTLNPNLRQLLGYAGHTLFSQLGN